MRVDYKIYWTHSEPSICSFEFDSWEQCQSELSEISMYTDVEKVVLLDYEEVD